jgi:Cu+-exporting ATPase
MGARNSTDAPQRVTLSVGGMTCASCSSAIADTLSGIVGVMDPAVNLIGNSATMIVQRKELVDTVVAAVRDTGFEADVFDVVPLASENDRNKKSISRTVTLRVGGMFCR